MKAVLVDVTIVRSSLDNLANLIFEDYILSSTQDPLISHLFMGNVGGLVLSLSFRDGWAEMELRSEKNVLKELFHQFQFHENVKISVFLEYKSGVYGPFSELAKFEGLAISWPGSGFACVGAVDMNGAFSDLHYRRPTYHVKIVADIKIDIATGTGTEVNNSNCPASTPVKDSNRPPFSRKIFEENVLSDVNS